MDKQQNGLMLSQIEMFEKQTGKLLEVKDGRPYYNGLLSCNSDYLPHNLVIDGSLMCYVDSTKLPKGLKVKNKLDISETKITEIPDDCEFGKLLMEDTKINKLRDNLELKYLNVCGSSLQELPKGLKVEGLLNISHTNITKIPDDCEFDSLNISYTKITKLRDNLELDCLIIHDTPLKNLPKNLIIFSFLGMGRNYFTTIPNDCLVTCVCCSEGFNDERYRLNQFNYYYLKDDFVHINHPSGREFLHVDGILSEVIEKKGNVYHVKNGVNEPISYVVTDGNNHWAHGYTLDSAKQDLRYKMSFRDKSEYEKLTLESELTFYEAVACYRVITGACKFGTNDYLKHRLPEPRKEKYTIKEIIELTKGEYGGKEFREFFENDNL